MFLNSGFHQSQANYSLLTLVTSTNITIVLIYVDGFLVDDNDLSRVKSFKNILSAHFKIKYLDSLKYFIGLKDVHSP